MDQEDACNTSKEWLKRIHAEDIDQVTQTLHRCLEDGSSQFEVQHRILHKDGSYRWLSCRGVITRDKTCKAIRIAGSYSDITAEKIADPLTGLPNRFLILNRLARAIESAQIRSDFLFAVIILDIGRPEGPHLDPLVIAAARRLEICLRARHTEGNAGHDYVIARSGGDEFIILAEGLGCLDEAKTISDRLIQELSAPFPLNDGEVYLDPSIGIALSATGYRNAATILRDADAALYRAKSLGKRRCEIFDTAILDAARNSLKMEADLKWAWERREFFLVYQPIVRLDSLEIAGFEALLRWNHPERGMIPPLEFVPIAEKTGLILPLGLWILSEASRQLKLWKETLHLSKDLYISVNVSPLQLRQPSFINEVSAALRNSGLDAEGLVLELTESGVMENPETAHRTLMQLRIMGARIALDDFGTGYSSLSRLCRFPLDYVKIDRSFVMGLESGSDTRDVVQAICKLAHTLGLRVIAEGIETPNQLESMRRLDCECGQGFWFSRPVGSEAAEKLLKHGLPQLSGNGALPAMKNEGNRAAKTTARKNRTAAAARKQVLIAASALTMILTLGILARFKPAPSSRQASAVPANFKVPAKAPLLSERPEPRPSSNRPAAAASRLPAAGNAGLPESSLPKAEKKTIAPAQYAFAVKHDHTLGGCKGTLKLTRNAISFTSENSKCSFSTSPSQCSCSVKNDQLTIEARSQKYRFKLEKDNGDPARLAQLDTIIKNIFKRPRR